MATGKTNEKDACVSASTRGAYPQRKSDSVLLPQLLVDLFSD